MQSDRDIFFNSCHRNQKPGGIPKGPVKGCLERPAATSVGQIEVVLSLRRNFMVWTG